MQQSVNFETERIVASLKYVDGIAWSHSGFLAIADVRQRRILKIDSTPMPKLLLENDGGASGLAYDVQGRLYICESITRRVSRMDLKENLVPLVENFEGKKFNAPICPRSTDATNKRRQGMTFRRGDGHASD